MNVFDRFTKDEVSANVWWPFAVVLVALCILTIPGQNRAEDQVRSDATARVSVFSQALAPVLTAAGNAPATGTQAEILRQAADDEVLLEDPPADVVRSWTPEGSLVFSTNSEDQVGSAEAVNDELIAAAMRNGQATAVTTTDLLGNPQEETFVTYTAIPAAGPFTAVVQIDYTQSQLLDGVRSEWMGYRIVLGVLALAVLLLAIFSLGEPIARIGAGVPFVPESVPRGQTLMETDELVTLKEAGAVARRRVEGVEERLKTAEEERWKLEGQLQQALSATHASEVADIDEVASPAVRPAPLPRSKPRSEPISVEPVASVDPVMSIPEPELEPEPKRKKEREKQKEPATPLEKAQEEPRPAPQPEPRPAAQPEPARVEPAKPEPRPAAQPEPAKVEPAKPEPRPAAQPEPAKVEPRPAARPDPAKVEPRPAAQPEPAKVEPAKPEPRPVAKPEPAREPEPVSASGDIVQVPEPDEVVVVPEPQPVAASSARPSADESPIDILERFLSSNPEVVPAEDPSLMRARLARTADLKKPGSRERREQREREEPSA